MTNELPSQGRFDASAETFFFQGQAALVAAGFGPAHIWAHYFYTGKPDIQRIYR